jgi:hypothetical protein
MDVQYTFSIRANALENERLWQLTDQALSWNSKSGPQSFALEKITDVRLQWSPSWVNEDQFESCVGVASGWTEVIPSTHFVGFNDFEARPEAFRRFVVTLLSAIAKANPACRFQGGASLTKFWLNVAAVVFSSLMLAGTLLLVGWSPWAVLGTFAVFALVIKPTAFAWFAANAPKAMPLTQALQSNAIEQWLPQINKTRADQP